MPLPEVLGPTFNGGEGGRIFWGLVQGTVWRDSGVPNPLRDIQHGGALSYMELGLHSSGGGGGGRNRGFWNGHSLDGRILICQ